MALMEVGIAARDFDNGRTKEGDILVVRKRLHRIGTGIAEQSYVIWLLVDESKLPNPDTLRGDHGKPKNRHQASLTSLGVNLSRARDKNDRYQPFVNLQAQGRITGQAMQTFSYITKP